MLDFCSNLVLGPFWCPSPSSGCSWFIALSKFNIFGDTPHPTKSVGQTEKKKKTWLNPPFAPKFSISAGIFTNNHQSSNSSNNDLAKDVTHVLLRTNVGNDDCLKKNVDLREWTVDDHHPTDIKNLHVFSPEGRKKPRKQKNPQCYMNLVC